MAAAVDEVGGLSSWNCRHHVATSFSAEIMVQGYEEVFEQVFEQVLSRS